MWETLLAVRALPLDVVQAASGHNVTWLQTEGLLSSSICLTDKACDLIDASLKGGDTVLRTQLEPNYTVIYGPGWKLRIGAYSTDCVGATVFKLTTVLIRETSYGATIYFIGSYGHIAIHTHWPVTIESTYPRIKGGVYERSAAKL